LEISNRPLWSVRPRARTSAFQEVWYLKLNDPSSHKALWLRFTLLQSKNGFKKIAETWGIFFQKKGDSEVNKIAVKQTYDLSAFSESILNSPDKNSAFENEIQIGECKFYDFKTKGKVQSQGHCIAWDFSMQKFFTQEADRNFYHGKFNLVPEALRKIKLVKNTVWTVFENYHFTGHSIIDGETHTWKSAPGMQGHLAGPKNGHSWVWGHCNTFLDHEGKPVQAVFEGLTGKASFLGALATPALSTFYFYYQGKEYFLNSLWKSIRSRSHHSPMDWHFESESGDLLFQGHIKADLRSFVGITYEDTNGSLLYCSNSKLADMNLLVFRKGKLEAFLRAQDSAAFEVVSRHKNPYVQFLL
jgi:hypothetical protein